MSLRRINIETIIWTTWIVLSIISLGFYIRAISNSLRRYLLLKLLMSLSLAYLLSNLAWGSLMALSQEIKLGVIGSPWLTAIFLLIFFAGFQTILYDEPDDSTVSSWQELE